jgi:hypothetical protein
MLQQSVREQENDSVFTLALWPADQLIQTEHFNDPVSPLHTFFPCFVNLIHYAQGGSQLPNWLRKLLLKQGEVTGAAAPGAGWGRNILKLEQNH